MKRMSLTKGVFLILYVAFVVGFMEFSLRLGGYHPWQIYQPVFPNLPVDLDFDSQFGWRNKPGQFVYPDFTGTGVITLTHAADGTRVTGAKKPDNSKGAIWVVGDSFVQGMAIADNETFAWKLQTAMPHIEVENLAVAGYGTYQSMLMVEQHLAGSESAPKLVIYGFNDFHEMRNTASFLWLRGITINSTQSDLVSIPYATVQNGQLVRHPPDKFTHWPLREHSALITAFEDLYEGARTWQRSTQGTEVTRQILVNFNKMALNNGTKFLVVFLAAEDPQKKLDYLSFFQEQGIEYLDCTHLQFNTPEMKVPREGHPNGQMNSYWAACMMTNKQLLELQGL